MLNAISTYGRVSTDVTTNEVGGQRVANFNVASTNSRKDKNTGEYGTNFYRVAAWGNAADIASRFLKKGHRVVVNGELIIRDYVGTDGAKHTTVEINARDITLVETKAEAEAKSGTAAPAATAAPVAPAGFTPVETTDGELPF